MQEFDFPGRGKMIAAFDHAVGLGCIDATTDAVRKSLIELFHDPDVELPACCFEPVQDHYARREIYRSPEHGYSVVAMTWAPDQGTPVHDHAGLWCVESVWQGELEITQYELLESADERYRFRKTPCMSACTGSAGRLIPPHEYHTIHNRDPASSAISLHIYEQPMVRSAVFEPLEGADRIPEDAWYSKYCKELSTDA